MNPIESLIHGLREFRFGWGTRALGRLTVHALELAKKRKLERSFAERIEIAVRNGEIFMVKNLPRHEPSEPISPELVQFGGFEERGRAVFLVVKPEWVVKTVQGADLEANLKALYGGLKEAIVLIDGLRAEGHHVLNGPEIIEIGRLQQGRSS